MGQAFGTKKAKKAIASLTENAIRRTGDGKINASSQAILDTLQETTKGMSTQQELAEVAAAAKPRPVANMDAEDINDVYTADNLLGKDIQKAIPILDWRQAISKREEVLTNSRYVAHRLQAVGTPSSGVQASEATSIAKLKLLRYLLALVEIHNSLKPGRDGSRLPARESLRNLAGMPDQVIDSIKRRFSTAGTMSRFQVDLMITHICALACIIDNFEVDTMDLTLDLNLDVKQMSKYFQEVGAKILVMGENKRKELRLDKAAAAQRKIAKLKLPLEYPKLPYMRKR